jgi:hypothetical protein
MVNNPHSPHNNEEQVELDDDEIFEAEYKLQNCLRVTLDVEHFITEVNTGKRWLRVSDYVTALLEAHSAKQVADAEIIGRCKELEVGDILPDFAFEHGVEWYIQGVKVPRYLARKISNAAKERRDKLLVSLTHTEEKPE